MKIKFKYAKTWDAHNFQVNLNGKKFPKERGAWYNLNLENMQDALEKALVWAIAEASGVNEIRSIRKNVNGKRESVILGTRGFNE